jgi:prepilin-type N-terminal cleavage/methylation domain-containing protein
MDQPRLKIEHIHRRSPVTTCRTAPHASTPVERAWASRGRHCAAFSLIELVIVLLIISVFAAISVPTYFDSLLFHRVESAARRVKSDLELVRETARLTSRAQTLTVTGMTYTATSAIASLDRPGQAYLVDLSQSPYELEVLAANFGGFTEVSFNGYGTPSSGGTVVLQARDHQCTVTLNGTTGQVSIGSNHTRARTAKVSTL